METNMKTLLVLLALVAVTSGVPSLRVRFGLLNSFIELPKTVSEAQDADWDPLPRPSSPLPQLELYCSPERLVCTLYDDTGYAAGLQVAIPQHRFTDAVFDWQTVGYTQWIPPVAAGDAIVTYWAISQFFVSEAFLQRSPEDRIGSRDANKLLQDDGIWVTGFNGQLIHIPGSQTNIAQNTAFTIQGCIPAMGRHYYYNATPELQCTSNTVLPWFGLVHDAELVGSGIAVYGRLPPASGQTNYFERPNSIIIRTTLTNGPECMPDLVASNGMLSMHIYFEDDPWFMGCIGQ